MEIEVQVPVLQDESSAVCGGEIKNTRGDKVFKL